eukprot:g13342.t1
MDVESDRPTDAVDDSAGAETIPSGPGGELESTKTALSYDMVGLSHESNHAAAAATVPEGGQPPSSTASVVDRSRLIAILAAEEQISAMANHLGSADPMTHLRSLLLPGHEASAPWFSRSATGPPAGHEWQSGGMGAPSTLLYDYSASDEVLALATAAANHPGDNGTEGFPHLSNGSQPSRGQGKAKSRKPRRSRSAGDSLLSGSKGEPWADSFAEESNHGRKKRSREGEVAGGGEEASGLGQTESSQDDFALPGLARSSSFSSVPPQQMTIPDAGVTGASSYCSLPKLPKASRLSWDLVRAFMKRKGAAQMRRLLEVWGHRLTSRALEEWRRRVRLEQRAEEAAAASKLQRVGLGFLGRRKLVEAVQAESVLGGRGKMFAETPPPEQFKTRKRGERRRAQRIVALKRRRRAAIKIQKFGRGFMGRRKAAIRRERLLQERMSVRIQAAWRGLLGRRKASQKRRDMEAMQAAQNEAAVRIQAVQRRKAAVGAVEARRRVRALQRRKSAEIAAVSIQRVVRGRAARAAAQAEVARREERQRAAAAVRIQRMARGRSARMINASTNNSHDAPSPVQTPPTEPEHLHQGIEKDDSGLASPTSPVAESYSGGDDIAATAAEPVVVDDDGGTRASLTPREDGVVAKHSEGTGTAVPAGLSSEVVGDQQGLLGAKEPSPVAAMSDKEEAARAQAASKIQAIGRGMSARAEARDRKQKREDEEARRASVWGESQQETDERANNKRAASGPTKTEKSPPNAAAVGQPALPASSSLFSSEGGSKRGVEAVTYIQAAFRGGKARWELDRRKEEFQQRKAEVAARAQEKREADAAVKIQTQARARTARAKRERHRQRHAARVGSIRSSGRAAADDLRALSRPGTAAAPTVTTGLTVTTAGEEGEENVHAWDGAVDALVPITTGRMSMGSTRSPRPQPGDSASFPLPAAIGVAAVRTPSSVGSPTSVTAAATAASATTTAGKGSEGGRIRSPGKARSRSYAASASRPGSGNSNRKASTSTVSYPSRSRSPSAASRRSVSGHDRGGGDGTGGGRRSVGGGMEMSMEDVERMHSEMRRGIENELHRELAAKLAEQEQERERFLREAEEERKRDRDGLEEAMRAVREAHDKDSEEIAQIKARLAEEEAARRAERDAGRQEYEQSLAEIRAEALAEAEKSRLAVEAVEALRREVEEEAQEQRRRQEEAVAQAQAREQEAKEAKERQMEAEKKDKAKQDDESIVELQRRQEQQKKEDQEKLQQRQLEEQQKSVMQQLAAENVERQRVALVQLQTQLREEEEKRLESYAAWEARQAEEEEIAKEQELRDAELRMQMESLRALQDKIQEQEQVRLEAERAAQAEQKAKEDAVLREGAKLMQEDSVESDDDNASDNAGEDSGSGGGSGSGCDSAGGSSRPKSTGTFPSSGSSRGTSSGVLVPADLEEAVKREIESATGSRLAQVEGALLELSRKQAELESREKELAGTAGAYLGADASATKTAMVPATTGEAGAVGGPSGVDNGDAVVASTGAATGVEWVEYWDESAGASYFFNTVTQEASWTNPHEAVAGRSGGGAGTAGVEGSGGGGPETLSQPEDGRAKWTECLDEASGATYYYNVVTGEAVWEKPAELSKKAETVAGVPQFERPEEWVCYLDENSGEEYWFNVTTGETHWGAT